MSDEPTRMADTAPDEVCVRRMQTTTRRNVSTIRAAYLRWRIGRNRCDARPGITHDWQHWEGPDFTSLAGWLEGVQCSKCRAAR